jgi:hypothetical protein
VTPATVVLVTTFVVAVVLLGRVLGGLIGTIRRLLVRGVRR